MKFSPSSLEYQIAYFVYHLFPIYYNRNIFGDWQIHVSSAILIDIALFKMFKLNFKFFLNIEKLTEYW